MFLLRGLFLSILFHHSCAGAGLAVEFFPLNSTRIAPDSFLGIRQQLTLQYLKSLTPENLTCWYTRNSNMTIDCEPYTKFSLGYYGHFVGHWMSATGQMLASLNDAQLRNQAEDVVKLFSVAQQAWTSVGYPGYVFISPPWHWQQLLDVNANNSQCYNYLPGVLPAVPWYTLHKVLAGLYDLTTSGGVAAAKPVGVALARWVYTFAFSIVRRDRVLWYRSLCEEWGGMNEALYNWYSLVQETWLRDTGDLFEVFPFTIPLATNVDVLSGLHANTHIPQVIGTARGWEVHGGTNRTKKLIATNFFHIVFAHHSWATFGSNDGEHWHEADRLGAYLNAYTEESCTQYNILKLARHLIQWDGDPTGQYSDFYEHAFINGLWANRNPKAPEYEYMLPLGGGGLTRPYSSMYQGFPCCWGTLTETYSKATDSVVYSPVGSPDVWFVQYIDGNYTHPRTGATFSINGGGYPFDSDSFTIYITLTAAPATPTLFQVYLRSPGWSRNWGASFRGLLNGQWIPIEQPEPWVWLPERLWHVGDQIQVLITYGSPRLLPLNDIDPAYDTTTAIAWGPLLFAGLTTRNVICVNNSQDLSSWITIQAGGTLILRPNCGSDRSYITAVPFAAVTTQQYTVYFNATGCASCTL